MFSDPRPWYRIENAAALVADVAIYDEIAPFGITSGDFNAELAKVSARSINLHLNTPGGLVDDGIAIFNALKNHPASIHVFIEGIAASIGSVIAMAGDEIVIAPHARMMIHNAHLAAMGDDEEFLKAHIELREANKNLANIYAERAGGTPDEWLVRMKAETWFSDKESVTAGLADRVGRSNDERAAAIAAQQIATFDLTRYRDGERIAARLVAELPHGDILPDDEEKPADEPQEPAETGDEPVESTEAEDPILVLARKREAERLDMETRLSLVKLVRSR